MKNIASLLGGVAVLALTASGAMAQVRNIAVTTNVGTKPDTSYTVRGTNGGNTATLGSLGLNANQSNSWKITGFVPADCALFTGGANGSQQEINLGELGIEGESDQAVNNLFDLRAPINLAIASGTAGCNTANTMTISKDNGASGLTNADAVASGGFDNTQFQANIPYQIVASFQTAGVDSLTVSPSEPSDNLPLGPWRSNFNMAISAQKPANGLVAGTYEDVITVSFVTTP